MTLLENDELIAALKLSEITKRKFRCHTVYMTCSLKEVLKHQLNITEFKQGCTFYEFIHKVENITDDKEIIFMHKVVKILIIPTLHASN